MKSIAPLLVLLGFSPAIALADIRLPSIIGEHMVLQQSEQVPLWGWADPGEVVRVTAGWSTEVVTTRASDTGKWSVKIKTPEAGGPYSMTFSGKNEIGFKDVLIGEVWLGSGQSNMQWAIHQIDRGAQEASTANFPGIRLFSVSRVTADTPQDDCKGAWVMCTPEQVKGFSAVLYLFGREIHTLRQQPVGLIHSSWGGTPSEAWTPWEAMEGEPLYEDMLGRAKEARAAMTEQGKNPVDEWNARIRKNDAGITGKWHLPQDSLEGWIKVSLPLLYENNGWQDFDGSVWFRSTFLLPAEASLAASKITTGAIDDMDTVYINGKRVGGVDRPGSWSRAREYAIPDGVLKTGENEIVIRVLDTAGHGGIAGPVVVTAGGQKVEANGEWLARIGLNIADDPMPPGPALVPQHVSGALYNGMISPIVPFGIRGVLWYQGESNVGRAFQYRTLFPRLISSWREKWEKPSLPFYFVQIAPFNYNNGMSAELREAQMMALSVPHTGMAITMDIGNPKDIHPSNKQDVAKRLALWARANVYGETELPHCGPIYVKHEVQGASIRLHFDHVYDGLLARTGELTHFQIAGDDRVFHPAQAKIDGKTIVVSHPDIKAPVAVRFGWGDADEPNLVNSAGLPASSFRTDDWPGKTFEAR